MPFISWSDVPWEAIFSLDLMIMVSHDDWSCNPRAHAALVPILFGLRHLLFDMVQLQVRCHHGDHRNIVCFSDIFACDGQGQLAELGIIIVSAFVLAPAGVWSLIYLEPDMFRRIMGGLILCWRVLRPDGIMRQCAAFVPKIIVGEFRDNILLGSLGSAAQFVHFILCLLGDSPDPTGEQFGVGLTLNPVPSCIPRFERAIRPRYGDQAVILVAPYVIGQYLEACFSVSCRNRRSGKLSFGCSLPLALGLWCFK